MIASNQLPVSAEVPNQAALQGLQNLPYNPPFYIQLQDPHLQQYAPYITGCVLMDLINNASKNQLRTFFFNLLSNNNWQTQEFQQLVQLVAAIADYLMMTQRMRPEQAVPAAVAEASPCYLANVVLQYRQGLERYITPALSNDLNVMLQKSQQWNAELQRFYQSRQQAMTAWGQPAYGAPMGGGPPPNAPSWLTATAGGMMAPPMGGYPPAGGGYPTVRGGYGPGPQQPMGYGFGQQSPASQAVRQQGWGMFSNPAMGPTFPGTPGPNGGQMNTGLKPRARRQENVMLSMSPDGDRVVEAWNPADGQNRTRTQDRNTQAFAFQPPSNEMLPPQHPMAGTAENTVSYPLLENPENPLEGMTLEDGTQVKLASKSSWKVTFNLNSPYRLLYDTAKHVLLHVRRPDGTVMERLEPITDDIMKYLNHELDPSVRRQAREQEEVNQPQIVPLWQYAQKLTPIKDNYLGVPSKDPEPVEEEGQDTEANAEETPQVHTIEHIPPVHSLKEGQLRLTLFAKSADVKPDTPVEMHFDVITPVTTSQNLVTVFKQLETCQTFEELETKLYSFDTMLDDEVRSIIDRRVTASLNEALQKNFGLQGWRIDSFKEDYRALQDALKEDHGEQLVEMVTNVAPEIVGQSLSVLSGEGFSRYLENVQDVDPDTASDILLALRDRTSITVIPSKLEDLRLGNLREGGLIPASEMPELYAAVVAIFERTPDYPVTFARRYLQTSDKKLLELRRGYLHPEAYLLFLVEG